MCKKVQLLLVILLGLTLTGATCNRGDLEELCKLCANVRPTPPPNPTQPTPSPTPVPTSSPTPSPSPSASPTSSPAPTAAPTPTSPAPQPPLLVLWKVQGYNSSKPYNCHNPQDGPKFQKDHVCVKDSTMIFCDPNNQSKCGPCDTDHLENWNTFCHKRDWDDPRGPDFTISGAGAEKDSNNPFYTNVIFNPARKFKLCVKPFNDVHTFDGIRIPVRGSAESCVEEVY